jgi:hypothetical protein
MLLADFQAAAGPWLHDLGYHLPGLAGTRHFWSISPVVRSAEVNRSNVRVGMENDGEYLGRLERLVLDRMLAVPFSVRRAPSIAAWREQTVQYLLAAGDLGLISVWSPSFVLLLLDALETNLERHLGRLPRLRRIEVERGLAREGRLIGEAIWPRLQVLSCWMDGPSADLAQALRHRFPRTWIQPKGLLATEGVVSIPLVAAGELGGVPALESHVIELLDLQAPGARPCSVIEAQVGGLYTPIISTGNGFARYHLKDVLRCTGRYQAVPTLRFEGKLDGTSDLRGEKLEPRLVGAIIDAAAREVGAPLEFALLAPVSGAPPRYQLFIETRASDLILSRLQEGVEARLLEGHHYRYCRELGQLGPVSTRRVRDGWKTYERTLTANGVRPGDIKPARLDRRPVWEAAFAAGELHD